ncbi:hypothetical protein MRO13_16080 [Vibrio metschnikovii]|nr:MULTISPECIES: hypothetical protein [unclassified Vibrio]EKO3678065.1 hypothetical protein [Vibrio metschnikovii]NNN62433.1 hypothetical protein [Vibrio sp. A11]NNN85762.1 hypothetical protein [Vibrio sp. A8-1]
MRENREENIIADLFSGQGYSIKREPDGNVPPDLLLDDKIAVEVTRLSKMINTHSSPRSIDSDSSSVIAKLKKAINTPRSNDTQPHRYSVTAIIKRPFGNLSKATLVIKEKLKEIDNSEFTGDEIRIEISQSISIIISKRNVDSSNGFLLTGIIDLDAGYHDKQVMLASVNFCHTSKAKKVEPYLDRYEEWWLVLSDTITYNGSDEYIEYIAKNICKSPFSRIIIVNSLDGKVVSEI